MPKELRAGLHERFADWLEARPSAFPVIIDELLGYHVERAVRLRRELGETEEATADARRAGVGAPRAPPACAPPSATTRRPRARCSSARPRSSDTTTRRAARCCPPLGASLFEAGRIAEAVGVLDEAIARAPGTAARGPRASRARVRAPRVRGERRDRARASAVADEALPVLERAGDQAGQCRAWYLRAQAAWIAGRVGRGRHARGARPRPARDGGRRARAVPDPRHARDRGRARTHAGRRGDRAAARSFRELVGASPVAAALMVNPLASLHAMRGEFELADGFLRRGQRDPGPARQPGLGLTPRGARAAARGPARRWPSSAARGRRAARLDGRRRAAGDDARDARAGGVRPGAARRRPSSCAGWPPAPARPTTS